MWTGLIQPDEGLNRNRLTSLEEESLQWTMFELELQCQLSSEAPVSWPTLQTPDRIRKGVSQFLKINLAALMCSFTHLLCVCLHTHTHTHKCTHADIDLYILSHTHAHTYKHTHAIGLFLWRTLTNTEWWQARAKRSSLAGL